MSNPPRQRPADNVSDVARILAKSKRFGKRSRLRPIQRIVVGKARKKAALKGGLANGISFCEPGQLYGQGAMTPNAGRAQLAAPIHFGVG
jgi:hypothetical protein